MSDALHLYFNALSLCDARVGFFNELPGFDNTADCGDSDFASANTFCLANGDYQDDYTTCLADLVGVTGSDYQDRFLCFTEFWLQHQLCLNQFSTECGFTITSASFDVESEVRSYVMGDVLLTTNDGDVGCDNLSQDGTKWQATHSVPECVATFLEIYVQFGVDIAEAALTWVPPEENP